MISNQDELNDLAKKDFEVISGDLTISYIIDSDAVRIGYFPSMKSLKRIEGDFSIINTEINSMTGFNNLEYVGGKLIVENNQSLTSFDGLQNLKHIESLLFINNTHVSDLYGLENIKSIDSSIVIKNTYLETINVFENILEFGGSIILDANSFLNDLSGFNNIRNIKGNLIISHNSWLSNLNGFVNLENINGNFEIVSNNKLTEINTFKNLSSVGGSLHLASIWLTNVDGLISLKEAGGIILENMEQLEGFSSLTKVNGDFILNWNLFLKSLEGLNNLETIKGILRFNFNYELYNVHGLESLESTGGLEVVNTPLGNLNGMSNLKNINGDIWIVPPSINLCGIIKALENFEHNFTFGNRTIQDILNECSSN